MYDVDTVARLGGDEFVVLIEDAPTPEIAELIAQLGARCQGAERDGDQQRRAVVPSSRV